MLLPTHNLSLIFSYIPKERKKSKMHEKTKVQDDYKEDMLPPMKLAVVVTALCLAIFCMALVSTLNLK